MPDIASAQSEPPDFASTLSQSPARLDWSPPGHDLGPLLDSVVSNIIRLAGSDAGLVSFWDADGQHLRASSAYGLDPPEIEQIEAVLDETMPALMAGEIGGAAALRTPRTLGDARSGRLFTVPLRNRGKLVGLLGLFLPEDRATLTDADSAAETPEHVETIVRSARLLERIIEEKRWLEAVIQHAAEGILISDATGRIIGGNPAFARITGLGDDAVRGRTVLELFDAGPTAAWSDGQIVELTLRHDRRRVFEASRGIIEGDQGEPIGGVITLRDVTARRQAEELQSTFFSVISHELKTPIAVIKGYADLLNDDVERLDSATVHHQLGIIREESDRLARMVENLLEASRIQSGALELRVEPLAIDDLIERSVRRLSKVKQGHQLVTRVPLGLPDVVGDPERLNEVLTNLIDNAAKYSPKGGRIEVSAVPRANDVVVQVADEGAGVPVSQREHIFERFSRLNSRVVRNAKGAGLGLFICKAIVEAHGGRIWVDSAPSGGAMFAFSLPRERPAVLPAKVGFAGLLGQPEKRS